MNHLLKVIDDAALIPGFWDYYLRQRGWVFDFGRNCGWFRFRHESRRRSTAEAVVVQWEIEVAREREFRRDGVSALQVQRPPLDKLKY